MKLKKINIDLKLQICFHTLNILTIHVISEIDQHYQLYWVLLNYYTLVNIICDTTKFQISKPFQTD
jgi:hypothetical protein